MVTRDDRSTPTERLELQVGRLSCAGEAAPLAARLRHLPGVADALVNPITETAVIAYDPAAIGAEDVVEVLRRREGLDVGTGVARWHVGIAQSGCTSCGSRLERAVRAVPGVRAAIVDLGGKGLTIEFVPRQTDLGRVRDVIQHEGLASRGSTRELESRAPVSTHAACCSGGRDS